MNRSHFATLLTVPSLILALTLSCRAADTAATTICNDGTTSAATGRGACSKHGGVQKTPKSGAAAAAKTPDSAAPAAAPPPASVPPRAAAAPATTTATKPAAARPSTNAGNTDAAGATAKCKDGSYSKSQHRSGTCSHHGGVAEWLSAAH